MVECCETNAAVRHSPVSYFLAPIDLVLQPDMGPTKIDMVLIFHEAQQSDASGKCAALYTVELQASLRLGVA